MKKFKVYVNQFNMGVFEAEDEDDALEAWAQDSGYQSLADLNEQVGAEPGHDVYEVVEIEA